MAAGATYEPIATQTLASAAAGITFSSIPATYTDLRIVCTLTVASATSIGLQANGDTATNYSLTYLSGTGTSAISSRQTSQPRWKFNLPLDASTTVPEMITADIFNYAGSTYKTMLGTESADTNGAGRTTQTVQLWQSTSAITSLYLFPSGANFNTGTTATLYGIKAE